MSTAFVLAGGGSIGAVQVGMLRELLAQGVAPDLVVGSSGGLRRLLEAHLPYAELERAAVPMHVVATDLLGAAW